MNLTDSRVNGNAPTDNDARLTGIESELKILRAENAKLRRAVRLLASALQAGGVAEEIL